MDLFYNYESDFNELTDSIGLHISKIQQNGTADEKTSEIQHAEAEIEEAEEILTSMSLTAQDVGAKKAKLTAKVKTYEQEIATLKKELKKAENFANSANMRAKLMDGASLDLNDSNDDRERLLGATEKIKHSSSVVKDTIMTAQETEQIGIDALRNLEDQRETMGRGMDRLRGINDRLGRASVIMRGMSRRVVTNKLIMAVIILVLLGTIFLVVYLKW